MVLDRISKPFNQKNNVMYKLKKILHLAITSFFIVLTSCDNDVIHESEVINPHLRAGSIRLYTKNENITFSKIFEYPYVKFSQQKMDYDTIGFSYTGYPDKSQSILGSIQITILNNMKLSYVEYRYPMDAYAFTYARWDDDDNANHANPLEYKIRERDDSITGQFKGNLYIGGNLEKEPFVIDSCLFSVLMQ